MKPNNLFLLTALICSAYLIFSMVKGIEYDGTFWLAVVTTLFAMGAWYNGRKNDNKHNKL